jgi:hypothetical protein
MTGCEWSSLPAARLLSCLFALLTYSPLLFFFLLEDTYRTPQMPENKTITVKAIGEEYSIAIFGTPSVKTTLDIGFRPKKNTTGSILGSVVYDSTRVNYRAEEAATENHEPGVPGIKVSLYRLDSPNYENGNCNNICFHEPNVGYTCPDEGNTVGSMNGHGNGKCLECTRFYIGKEGETKPLPFVVWTSCKAQTGDITVEPGQVVFNFSEPTFPTKVAEAITAEFQAPVNCMITDNLGKQINFTEGQNVLPDPTPDGVPCIESPLLRNQVGGFTEVDGTFKFENLEPGLYAIAIEIPMDLKGTKPAYKVRSENDINAYDSDEWDGNPVCPSKNESCPLPEDKVPPDNPSMQNVMMPCAGALQNVLSGTDLEDYNPSFADNGGSFDGVNNQTHRCDIKLVLVEGGVNKRATFHLFTDVPIPSRWKGVVLNDLTPQANPKSTLFTENEGVARMPVGVRDFAGTKLTDAVTDVST